MHGSAAEVESMQANAEGGQALANLSVVVPMLDEAAALPALIETLAPLRAGGAECVLVDGGSRDGSPERARAAGLGVVDAPRGRANQLAAGVAASRGEIVLLLHADTRLPERAGEYILATIAAGRHVWGRFDVHIAGRSAMLPVVAKLMNSRSRLSGIATGDQAIFVTRSALTQIGGIPLQPLMEDIELSRRLKRLSAPACLRARVTTSGRRWDEHGAWRTIRLMWALRWAYWRGADPHELARRYR